MNPQFNMHSYQYTVLGLLCHAPNDRPSLDYADPPPGMTSQRWLDLKGALNEGRYLRNKLLSLFSTCVGAFLVLGVGLPFVDKERCHEKGGCNGLGNLLLMAFIFVSLLIQFGLAGRVHLDSARRAIATLKPNFRQAGWEMDLSIQGSLFFIVGTLTITPGQYEPNFADL